jgi:hypothetical protein
MRKLGMPLDVAPAHEGAKGGAPMIDPDAAKRRNGTYVYQQLGCGDAEGKHRHQALPASYDLGFIAMLGQKGDRLFDAASARIVKRRRLH